LYKRRANTECAQCKKSIYRRPCQIKKGQVFCGVPCYGLSQRNEKPCIVCGNPVMASLHKKTCSRGCSNTHRAGIKYRTGGLYDKVKSGQALKTRLLQIKGKNCERCSYNKYDILQIHHIDRNRNNNDLSNLELICPNCHYEEHYLSKINKQIH
jgi:HNH endonuclease